MPPRRPGNARPSQRRAPAAALGWQPPPPPSRPPSDPTRQADKGRRPATAASVRSPTPPPPLHQQQTTVCRLTRRRRRPTGDAARLAALPSPPPPAAQHRPPQQRWGPVRSAACCRCAASVSRGTGEKRRAGVGLRVERVPRDGLYRRHHLSFTVAVLCVHRSFPRACAPPHWHTSHPRGFIERQSHASHAAPERCSVVSTTDGGRLLCWRRSSFAFSPLPISTRPIPATAATQRWRASAAGCALPSRWWSPPQRWRWAPPLAAVAAASRRTRRHSGRWRAPGPTRAASAASMARGRTARGRARVTRTASRTGWRSSGGGSGSRSFTTRTTIRVCWEGGHRDGGGVGAVVALFFDA